MPAVAQALVMLAICAVVLGPLEWWRPRRGVRQDPRALAVCAGLFLVNAVLAVVMVAPLLSGVGAVAARWTCAGSLAMPLRLVAILVLADVAGYAMHRAMHRCPVLWRFHQVHHAAHDLTWWETWRQHPVDAGLHAIAVGLPGAMFGASASEGFGLVLLRVLYTAFLHADVRITLGPAEGLVATPAFHHRHHSHDPRHRNCNFSTTLALIDRICGTAVLSDQDTRTTMRPRTAPARKAGAMAMTSSRPISRASPPSTSAGTAAARRAHAARFAATGVVALAMPTRPMLRRMNG
jgi:sterol desaturase/sphingolipid hydroxylase (fatty acid hydroxylase superfamily)